MSEPIRVLQVLGRMNLGGTESRTMDLYRSIDREKIQFDFCVHTDQECHFDKEIKSLGGRIYHLPRFRAVNYFAYRRAWKKFFREHQEFRVVHGHMTSTAAIYLPIAGRDGHAITVAHARNAGVEPGLKGLLTRLLRSSLYKKADYCFTCSKLAGAAVFGRKRCSEGRVTVVPNAIDCAKYRFDDEVRRRVREEWKLEGKFVIGHVGRFQYQKNHDYLLDIFACIVKKIPEAVLMLVGGGELEQPMKDKAAAAGISGKVIFAGNRPDVNRLYQAMDYFVFPSHFEGLPGVVLEAQAAGLRCLISDTIAEEVCLTELVSMRSIREAAGAWAEEVIAGRSYERKDMLAVMASKGFDTPSQVKHLEDFYLGVTEGYLV